MNDAAPSPRCSNPGVPGESQLVELANGLRVVIHHSPQAPIVSTLVLYRAGTRDEETGRGGCAHFLEHRRFKGSARYGAGEIDRLTQALGGMNNAFTTHDATAYYFQFAKEHWRTALEVERDRMLGLLLEEHEVESERRVILEEIASYDNDPWAALDLAVQRALFDGSAYGKPVLGSAAELERIGAGDMRLFHQRHYGPDRATVVVGGDVEGDALDQVAGLFGDLAARSALPGPPAGNPAAGRPVRVLREHGSVSRLLLSLVAPPPEHPDHPALRLVVNVLVVGRASRLQRILVDESKLCLFVAGELREYQTSGSIVISTEAVPEADPARIEAMLLGELALMRQGGISGEELERARCLVRADWLFSHERVHQQTLQLGYAAAFTDLGFPGRYLERVTAVTREDAERVARRYLDPERGAVVGWSHPAARR